MILMKSLFKVIAGAALVLLLSGCNSLKRHLGLVREGPEWEVVVNVYEDSGAVLSDHFVIADSRLDSSGIAVIVELCTAQAACLPLPFRNDPAAITVTYLRQGPFLSIYNAQAGLPAMTRYRIQI